MNRYPHIFEPITINGMTLKNRIVMPPMGSNFANYDGTINDNHIKYYEQRAKGGTALITLENVCFDYPMGTNGTTQLRMDNDQFLPGLWKFNERMHAYGACTSVQINHAGASATNLRLNGIQPVSASDVPSKKGMNCPRPLTVEEIKLIVNRYAAAADRAKRAGFDCIEIHAGHSYLLDQFLSPHYNHRNDQYGGSVENRARFANEVLESVRKAVGPRFPISVRISADEFVKDGNTVEDVLELLKYFSKEADILNVSAGINDNLQYQIDKMNLPDGWRSFMAQKVKNKFNKVTITSGNFRSPQVTERVLETGQADLVAMGRGLIAEPNWVNKVKFGNEEMLRKCISCNIGCADHRIGKGLPLRCTVNPDVIGEDDFKRDRLKNKIKIVVIGGGTTGLEAACSAAEIGAEVYLYEKKSYLGGLAHEIARLPDKHRIDDYVNYLQVRAEHLSNLVIHLNEYVDLDIIKNQKPDIIVNATGAHPFLPSIEGLQEARTGNNSHVFDIFDLLNNLEDFNQGENILVIGGGAVGLDVMEYFTEHQNCKVTMVELLPEIGKDLDIITKLGMKELLDKYNVKQFVGTKLLSISNTAAVVSCAGKERKLLFDKAFVCLGMRSYTPGFDDLQQFTQNEGITLLNIGDSKRARRIYEGTQEARGIINEIHLVDKYKKI
ncbi:oxidoreductase [Liquorilactobacillus mali]|uniref:NADH flavin oxidoreductase n=1 Tax=Liquorilactobacillus mali KCTC 3596 = DSM 20444 TaxID=1046596 RepID=J0KZF7_9LACO|nr:FAD-dependent oxidoreductase [Liquorilactobacillus mali]EJE99956.1 NADH:flavin oxidoreductase [Liquorilactobacillus mali KCTC 3596 = DSM 20444]KRN11255.1 NADH flavin oxidoreductase [Liquorilactobacillus mali KCTC 3596 = DSM 20444]QFQ73758.1 NAD(P)-binding protein [Liquorilactobacillus mali]